MGFQTLFNKVLNNVIKPNDLDLWPMTFSFKMGQEVIHIHALTKFHDPKCNIWIIAQYFFSSHRQTDGKRCKWTHHAVCTGGLKKPICFKNTQCLFLQLYSRIASLAGPSTSLSLSSDRRHIENYFIIWLGDLNLWHDLDQHNLTLIIIHLPYTPNFKSVCLSFHPWGRDTHRQTEGQCQNYYTLR